MLGQLRNLYSALLLSCVFLTLLFSLIYLFHPAMVESINLRCTDIVAGSGASLQKSETEIKVLLVDIDDASLQTFGQWPWPRYRLANLLQIIKEGGAAAIGVDILFPEKDRTSPKTWQENLRNDFGYEVDTSRIPEEVLDHDIYLANVLSSGPFVLGNEFLFTAEQAGENRCLLHPVTLVRKGEQGQADKQLFHHADGVLCNYAMLEKAAGASGFLNGNIDIDGNIRRLPLMIEFEEQVYPSFALAVVLQYHGTNVVVFDGMNKGLPLFSFMDLHIPTDDEANFFLGPLRPQGGRNISAIDVLAGKVDATTFKNTIVLVGLTASGLTQQYPTPFSPVISLLELHKYAIESLVSSRHTIRMPDFIYLEIAASFVVCLGLALCIIGLVPFVSGAVAAILVALVWIVATLVCQVSGLLFSPLLPSIAVIFNFFLLISLRFKFFQVQARSEAGDTLLLLKSSEDNLRSILETIPDIVFRLDKQGRITFISPAVSKYLQTSDRLVGRHVFDLVDPEDRDKAKFRLNERRTGDRATKDLEIRLLSSEIGDKSMQQKVEEKYFSVSAEGIYSNGTTDAHNFIGTQGIAKDITNRKSLERQLIRAQKMEVVGNLAAGIAHDLNNILSGLVSYPDLLLLEIPQDSPLYKKVQLIQKSGRKAATIVQDLLTLARRSVDVNTICNMNDIILDYLSSVEFEKIKSNYPQIVIRQELADGLLNIKGSTAHLSKVVMNIIHNAMEAMPAGGEITVATQNRYVDIDINGYECIPQGEYVCTTISDNGVGIPAKDLQRIFEPFFTKKSMGRSGSGLGMTVIWATVKDHDGYLDMLSQEGRGTVITLFLPSTREVIDSLQRRIVLDDYTGSENILVVDDVEEQVEIASTMLAKLGYSVVTAVSGARAVELVRRQSFDLLVLDMIMPGGLDGLETYEEIIRFYPQQKAIITSGYSASERVKLLQELGAGVYVQKPYSMETLGIAVRQELDKKGGANPGQSRQER